MDARKLVAYHAWQLLEGGEMIVWLRLHDSIRSLPGGLQLIMEEAGPHTAVPSGSISTARRKLDDTEKEQGEDDEEEAEAMLSSISRMASEFPLWGGAEGWDENVEAQAQEARRRVRALLTSCPSASTTFLARWELALSVILSDGPEVAELKAARPNLWLRMMNAVRQPSVIEATDIAFLEAILSLADEVVAMN